MANTRLLFLILICFPLVAFPQPGRQVLLTIDGSPIEKEEFERIYQKNNLNLLDESDKKSPSEYLELFINFKLKVHDAKQLGMDTLPSFREELAGYRAELAKPYLTDIQFDENTVKSAYERVRNEVSASHILIRLAPDATPKDTFAIYNQLMELRTQIQNGADFGEIAATHSQDPSAKANNGFLGYFGAFQMVYPFEVKAFETSVGAISLPVRTSFGYHIIKVHDKRPASGELKVAHIMKAFPNPATEEQIARLKTETDSLAALLQAGEDFSELAKRYSDDKRSAQQGGEMPWFSTTNMVPEFAQAAFSIHADGGISPVIRTPFGWHIIKRLQFKPVASFDEMKPSLVERIRQNPEITNHAKNAFLQKLKTEYNFVFDQQQFDILANDLKNCFFNGLFVASKITNAEKTVFSFSGKDFVLGDFAKFLEEQSFAEPQASVQKLNEMATLFAEKELMLFENSRLEEKHPDFRYLMQEYHDGILLFNLSEQKIWNAAQQDSAGLAAFYQQNKEKHLWGERFSGWIVKCNSPETRELFDLYTTDENIPAQEIMDRINTNGQNLIEIKPGKFEKGNNAVVDYYVWNQPKPNDLDETIQFVRGNKIEAEPKALDEARSEFISDYQTYLEEQWIKSLRKKYRVKVSKKVLQTVKPLS